MCYSDPGNDDEGYVYFDGNTSQDDLPVDYGYEDEDESSRK